MMVDAVNAEDIARLPDEVSLVRRRGTAILLSVLLSPLLAAGWLIGVAQFWQAVGAWDAASAFGLILALAPVAILGSAATAAGFSWLFFGRFDSRVRAAIATVACVGAFFLCLSCWIAWSSRGYWLG